MNSVAQVAFAALVLASLGFGFQAGVFETLVMIAVAMLTALSMALYFVEWARHMSTTEPIP
jgi:cardiolipin synthase